jgi:hypothetical protein
MRTVLLVSAVLLTGFAPAPFVKPERKRERRDPLLGAWVVKKINWHGQGEIGGIMGSSVVSVCTQDKVTIGGGRLVVEGSDRVNRRMQGIVFRWEYRSDPISTIDLTAEGGGMRMPGLYRAEGDKLTLSFPSSSDKQRPAAVDRGDLIITLQRK